MQHAWRALRHRNFQLFFVGQGISVVGTWMTRVATSWLVYRLTHSALLLGVVSFAGQIVSFALGPVAGVWVERLDRRKLLVWTQAPGASLFSCRWSRIGAISATRSRSTPRWRTARAWSARRWPGSSSACTVRGGAS